MEDEYDAIVIGLGAMGSASLYQLAKRGVKVLGIDRFSPPHKFGSTHGDTRITRQAIGEGEQYVPLALRSHEIWREIEQEIGKNLLTITGGVILGNAEAEAIHGKENFIAKTIETAQKYSIKHDVLSAQEIRERFPQFKLGGNEKGYFEYGAGFLKPEACIEAQLELAKKYGAEIHTNEDVQQFIPLANDRMEVRTLKGVYKTRKVIVSIGPWIKDFFPEYSDIFKVYRQVLYWFDIKENKDAYSPDKFPVFIWDFGNGKDVYGFPAVDGPDGGLKIAAEQYEVTTSANDVDRSVTEAETKKMYGQYIRDYFPDISDTCIKSVSCLYTVTPDSDFVIDTHPIDSQIILVSPCSGHGFKHSAAIGEVVAEMVIKGKSTIDISKFSLKRFFNK